MLPSSELSRSPSNGLRFADTAIPLLQKAMLARGARVGCIKAKIAGGAQMFAVDPKSSIANIGGRNVIAVKQALQKLKIPIVAEDTGKNYGRTLYFAGQDGKMVVKSAKKTEIVL